MTDFVYCLVSQSRKRSEYRAERFLLKIVCLICAVAAVAQLVEPSVVVRVVAGSNPVGRPSTKPDI